MPNTETPDRYHLGSYRRQKELPSLQSPPVKAPKEPAEKPEEPNIANLSEDDIPEDAH